MRFAIHSLILFAVLAGSAVHAGENPPNEDGVLGTLTNKHKNPWADSAHKAVLKLHPILAITAPVIGVYMLPVEFELAFHPNFSAYASGSPLLLVNGAAGGFALNAGMRGYLSGNAPDGFWLGAQLGVSFLSSGVASATAVDLQPQLGYQWVADNGFSIGIGAGLSLSQLATRQFPLTFMLPLGIAW